MSLEKFHRSYATINRHATERLSSPGDILELIIRAEIVSFSLIHHVFASPRMAKRTPPRSTPSRKKQHVELALNRNVGFRAKTTGFENLEFINNALPEINLHEIATSTVFLGHTLSSPFMISCMTGGYADALAINRQLAEVCEEMGIAMGVGSQRQALEDTQYHRTFSVVREVAQSIPVVGNIGAAEIAGLKSAEGVLRLVELIRADGFAVHLNPVQELLQPEGNTNFRGVLKGISLLVRELPVPVIVKEIGAGISTDVARRLLEAGVHHIDIAGAGGTSWAGVEILRGHGGEGFWDWGIPTARAIRDAGALKSPSTRFTLIASGGIASGMDAAKSIALGADLVGAARPMLLALHRGGKRGLKSMIAAWAQELRGIMFLTGSGTIADLQRVALISRETA